jgi:DNA-binding NarL/FixJ family response regulator
MIKIGIVDDHQLFAKSLSLMLASFKNYQIVVEALNGKDLQEKLADKKIIPEIMLIDVNMPIMNGIETAKWMHKKYPSIKMVALSMNDEDRIIIDMLKAGCCAYLLKDTHPNELENALTEIIEKGFYNADATNVNYRSILQMDKEKELMNITEREKVFLKLACSDFTYKEIAKQMNVSHRTIDGYREELFKKFKVQSRVGLILEALRKDIIKL